MRGERSVWTIVATVEPNSRCTFSIPTSSKTMSDTIVTRYGRRLRQPGRGFLPPPAASPALRPVPAARTAAKTNPGHTVASAVNAAPSADQRDNHWDTDSLVQNDHRMQIKQNVANVLIASRARLPQLRAVLARLRSRPRLASHSELITTRAPSIVQKSTSCHTNRRVPRSQNHW